VLLVQLFKDIIVGNPDYNRINSKYTVIYKKLNKIAEKIFAGLDKLTFLL
jgi:hypothetical protein